MQALPIFVGLAGRSVIVVGEGEAAAAKARLVTAAGGIVSGEDAVGVVLAFVALDDETAAVAAADRLRARGLLVNVVDRPTLSDFLMGSIIDRAPVTVAISTGGATASLARALRGRLEALLPASLGPLAKAIGNSRAAVSAAHTAVSDRRRLWERALAEGAALDPLKPLDDPQAAVAAVIGGVSTAFDEVRVIDVRSDDPGDLTLNQLGWLGRCDSLVVEGAVAQAIVDRARRDAVRLAVVPQPAPEGLTLVLRGADQASSSVSQ